jgi:hypothetical protein
MVTTGVKEVQTGIREIQMRKFRLTRRTQTILPTPCKHHGMLDHMRWGAMLDIIAAKMPKRCRE